MGYINEWVHLEAIQALIHHASAVITAIFIFAVSARLIAYLIPDGHAKRLVMIIDDVVLVAVFGLAGWRLLSYMWFQPQVTPAAQKVQLVQSVADGADSADELIAQCRKLSPDDLLQCLRQKKLQAERAMADAVARMSTDMRALDKVGSTKIGAARSFDAAQATFLLYRETECRWLSTTARSGAADTVYQACMADLAHRRAARIDQILRR